MNCIIDTAVTYATSDANIAMVSSSGLVTGISEGSAVISAATTGGAFSDTCSVFVCHSVPGNQISSNETWSGNIILRGDIEIDNSITLTIQPGTKIFVSNANLDTDDGIFATGRVEIYSHGTINANGTSGDKILLTSADDFPESEDWWGIGLTSGSVTNLSYCSILYAEDGLFIFSTSSNTPSVVNCLFAYGGNGIVDFGPNSTFSYNSYINNYYSGYSRWEDGRTVTINYSLFQNIHLTDVEALKSNNVITIYNSNFIDNDWYNLYISDSFSPINVTITADNCFGITTWEDNGCGTITITNPASVNISGAGCGYALSDLPIAEGSISAMKGIVSSRKIIDKSYDYNELDKYFNERTE